MKIDVPDFVSFHSTPVSRVWDIGNNMLYELCEKYPLHKNVDEIVAKLWLIGRSYAAAIERTKRKKESSDRFYVTVGRKLMRSTLDAKLSKIPNNTVLTHKIIGTIIDAHVYLTKVFHDMTKIYKVSLASKYLHFHRPLVPLCDSRAQYGIGRIFRNHTIDKGFVKCFTRHIRNDKLREKEKEYIKFVLKMHSLQQHLHDKTKTRYTVRDIDKYLLHLYERANKAKYRQG